MRRVHLGTSVFWWKIQLSKFVVIDIKGVSDIIKDSYFEIPGY
jgi:hypothetical protein